MRLVPSACCGVVFVAVAIAAFPAPARPAAHVTIVGARPAERQALDQLVQTMSPSRIRKIRMTPPPRPGRPPLQPGTVRMTIDAGSSMEGHWEADLLIRRYVRIAAPDGLRQVAGFHPSTARALRTGVPLDLSLLRRFARKTGARLIEARTYFGVAVAAVVRVPDPAAFLEHEGAALVEALKGPQPQAVSFFAIEDGSGSVVYEAGSLSGIGFFWARPNLVACGPVQTFGRLDNKEPRCGG